MPDGSAMPARPGSLPAQHVHEIDRVREIMLDDPVWARAAVAWLQVAAPGKVPGATDDPAGFRAHLWLFAREPRYWDRLCVLFERRGLADRWGER